MNIFKQRNSAIAYLKGGNDAPLLQGVVRFYQKKRGVLIEAYVSGLPENNSTGFFAFHIHEGKSCTGEDFADTGAHYNPKGVEHPMHAGDLPPLLSAAGEAYLSVLTNRFSVTDIIGKTVVIHSNVDDFKTQPSGNAGKKIACGVILAK